MSAFLKLFRWLWEESRPLPTALWQLWLSESWLEMKDQRDATKVAHTTLRTSEPHIPVASKRQLAILEEMKQKRVSSFEVGLIKELISACGKYGCVYVCTGRAQRRMEVCPGWCSALEQYEQDERTRCDMYARKIPAKPRALSFREQKRIERIKDGSASTEDLLFLEKLTEACKCDGCVREGITTQTGITVCPCWCDVLSTAWESWWEK